MLLQELTWPEIGSLSRDIQRPEASASSLMRRSSRLAFRTDFGSAASTASKPPSDARSS